MSEPRKKRRVTTSREWVERGPLAPWMLRYLQWLAQHPEAVLSKPRSEGGGLFKRGRPFTQERTAAANRFACRKIHKDIVQLLERRPDAIEYFNKLRSDLQFQAREAMRQDLMEGIEARREALQFSRSRTVTVKNPDGTEEQRELGPDVKAIDSLTRWVPEVAFPKKEREGDQRPTIVLHLGDGASKRLLGIGGQEDEDIVDVEYEIIPPKQLTDGEDDG